MLTLSDINRLTNSKDGDIYSDLHKDVCGFRPRGCTFKSVEDFDRQYESLVKQLEIQNKEEELEHKRRFDDLLCRIETIKLLVSNADTRRAVEIIAEAEGIDKEEMSFYGWESLEWKLGLKFGSIKPFLAEAA